MNTVRFAFDIGEGREDFTKYDPEKSYKRPVYKGVVILPCPEYPEPNRDNKKDKSCGIPKQR